MLIFLWDFGKKLKLWKHFTFVFDIMFFQRISYFKTMNMLEYKKEISKTSTTVNFSSKEFKEF